MTLIKPTIHLNGTSREALLEGYCNAIDALHEAGRKVAAAYPNGRDYYVQGAGATEQAMQQHEARMNKLKSIIGELEEIAMHIQDSGRPDYGRAAENARRPDGSISVSRYIANCDAEERKEE